MPSLHFQSPCLGILPGSSRFVSCAKEKAGRAMKPSGRFILELGDIRLAITGKYQIPIIPRDTSVGTKGAQSFALRVTFGSRSSSVIIPPLVSSPSLKNIEGFQLHLLHMHLSRQYFNVATSSGVFDFL